MLETKIRVQLLRDTINAVDSLQEADLVDEARQVLIKLANSILAEVNK
jgi:hypothetical protein